MTPVNDPEAVRRQYATDEQLLVRQRTHDLYTVPKIHFVDWALNTLAWRGDERVLDVGCGTGLYYQRLHTAFPQMDYHGFDVSIGMIRSHGGHILSCASADHIPYADDVFDVVMANHMLFYVQDVERAISEFRRVLKPGGVLMVATNSINSMPEFQVLLRRAIVLLTRYGASAVRAPAPSSDLFALENGTRILARRFFAVVRHDLPSKLVFEEVEPAIAYLESTRQTREPQLPDDVAWEDVMMIMRQQITQLINHLGSLEIVKLTGVLLATDDGGFIQDYTMRQNGLGQPASD